MHLADHKSEKQKAQKKVFKVYEKLGAEEEQCKAKMKDCENRDYSARQVSEWGRAMVVVRATPKCSVGGGKKLSTPAIPRRGREAF